MDKSWIDDRDTFSDNYKKGVKDFLEFAKQNALDENDLMLCPCRECNNGRSKTEMEISCHLHVHGFSKLYRNWIYHGEIVPNFDGMNEGRHDSSLLDDDYNEIVDNNDNHDDNDELEELLEEIKEAQHSNGTSGITSEDFEILLKDAKRPIYPGSKFSLLSTITTLMHMKVMNKWTNKSFNMLLDFLKKLLPEGEILPPSLYKAMNILSGIGLGYERIDVCKYDCALFWKENKDKEFCPVCKESRWSLVDGKTKRIPQKVLRYFPIKPRLQRLFLSSKTAPDMRWHKDKRVDDGVMRHPADSPAWKELDKKFPHFGNEPRNVRLGLTTDGFNPFGNMSNSYSMWPVILMVYNLPSYQIMRKPYLIMPLLIPGPRSPGKDIDIYLRPLIEDLKDLWNNGIETFDGYSGVNFLMRAALLWTVSDFPAYGYLSGWVTQGYNACPCCFDETESQGIRSKICFMGHRKYLPSNHRWRKSKSKFNGQYELRAKSKELTGEDVLEWLKSLKDDFEKLGKNPKFKKRKRSHGKGNWVKMSIFFELPYWSKLLIRHILDVMHVEKNICDNVFATLLNIPGKTKDTEKAREDLRDMKIRKELHLIKKENKTIKPSAFYVLAANERKGFIEFLRSIKFPDGFASNISRCVKDGKVSGLKSHDCHVLLQRLIPVGLRGYLRNDIRQVLFELGNFFKELCSKTLKVEDVEKLEHNIPLILCKLESIYPPAFFDVMVHLSIHLPKEAKIAGPVHPRWMYPIERNLGYLKKFVRNKARPEGSIAEGYIANECLTYLSMYLPTIETQFNRQERNYDGGQSLQNVKLPIFSINYRPFGLVKSGHILSDKEFDAAYWYILRNCDEVDKYLKLHEANLLQISPANILNRQMREFPSWFRQHINHLHYLKLGEVTDDIWALANGPNRFSTKIYSACIVNEVRFHTKYRDSSRRTQNHGIFVEGHHEGNMVEFFGTLDGVVELSFLGNRNVVLFQCEWFDTGNKKSMQNDGNFISVDTRSRWYKDDPFVLPNQVQQVFYVDDTKLGSNWKVVQKVQHRHLWDLPENEISATEEIVGEEMEMSHEALQQYQSNGIVLVNEDDDDQDFIMLSRQDIEGDIVGDKAMQRLNKLRPNNENQNINKDFIDDTTNEDIYQNYGSEDDESFEEDNEE